jgi:hypothetical protein
MSRTFTPPRETESGGTRITVHRHCDSCGRDIGDATREELEAAIAGAPLPDVAAECGCARAIEQLSLFAQARDARASGAIIDGIAHPTWDEIDPVGRQEYLADATAIVRAIVALGWAPKEVEL